MGSFFKRTTAATAVLAMAAGLAACGGGSDSSSGGSTSSGSGAGGTPVKGGTVTLLDIAADYAGTDPAAIYFGHQIAEFRRLVYRSLVAFPASKDSEKSATPVPDLATDAGTTPDGGKTWSFTVKDGVKWEDGKAITCEDFAYGMSRSFDPNLVADTGPGLTYLGNLDIPKVKNSDGDEVLDYNGPFSSTPAQQANYDKAVSCSGNTITYKFTEAFPDFPLSVAALFVADPYRKDLDQGAKNHNKIISDGPYKVEDQTFDPDSGATFVRNDNYDPSTDSKDLRGNYPDTFKIELLQTLEAVYDRLVADSGSDQTALSTGNVLASYYSQITGPVAARTAKVPSPYTRFLQINSLRLTDPKVRLAVATALDRSGAVKAFGGANYGTPTTTIVSKTTPGYQENAAFKDIPDAGDPAAAKKLLEEAGKENYPLKVSYGQTDQNDKVFALFKQNLEAAGFKVTLNAVASNAQPSYYAQMNQKDKDTDVFYAGWASDWQSLLAVIPSILETNNPGFNYGPYSNPEVDKLIKDGRTAFAAGDGDTMIKDLQEADATAGKDVAYIPILQQNNYFLYGSKIGGFLPDSASSFYPDLATIYAKK